MKYTIFVKIKGDSLDDLMEGVNDLLTELKQKQKDCPDNFVGKHPATLLTRARTEFEIFEKND